jgi:phosphopantetheinyl transferase
MMHELMDRFAERSRDVTPAGLHRAARLLYAPVASEPELERLCSSALSTAERTRACRFGSAAERSRFVQRRVFRRVCAGLALGTTDATASCVREIEGGRPYVPGSPDLWVSFSSCPAGMIGGWSWGRPIGVDIEDEARTVEPLPLARELFSAAEAEVIACADPSRRRSTFLRLWTLKEAALKSIGEGLPLGLAAFEFELEPELRIVRTPTGAGVPAHFRAWTAAEPGWRAAVVVDALGH